MMKIRLLLGKHFGAAHTRKGQENTCRFLRTRSPASKRVLFSAQLLNCGADPNTVLPPSLRQKIFWALLPNGFAQATSKKIVA